LADGELGTAARWPGRGGGPGAGHIGWPYWTGRWWERLPAPWILYYVGSSIGVAPPASDHPNSSCGGGRARPTPGISVGSS